jgi:hypothetical protein
MHSKKHLSWKISYYYLCMFCLVREHPNSSTSLYFTLWQRSHLLIWGCTGSTLNLCDGCTLGKIPVLLFYQSEGDSSSLLIECVDKQPTYYVCKGVHEGLQLFLRNDRWHVYWSGPWSMIDLVYLVARRRRIGRSTTHTHGQANLSNLALRCVRAKACGSFAQKNNSTHARGSCRTRDEKAARFYLLPTCTYALRTDDRVIMSMFFSAYCASSRTCSLSSQLAWFATDNHIYNSTS